VYTIVIHVRENKKEISYTIDTTFRNKQKYFIICYFIYYKDIIIKVVEFLTWYWWRWREEFVRDYFCSSQLFAVSCSLEKYPVAELLFDCPEDSRPSTILVVGSFVRATWPADCISSLAVPIPWVRRKRRRPEVLGRCSLDSIFSSLASQPERQVEFFQSH